MTRTQAAQADGDGMLRPGQQQTAQLACGQAPSAAGPDADAENPGPPSSSAPPASSAGRSLMMRWHGRTGVWANRQFTRLWVGQTTSQMGSMVTAVALPLVAVVTLHANPAQMGLLSAVGRLPYLLYLVAGVWVDRTRPRRLLIGADLGRGLLLLIIPAAAITHLLTMTWLMAVLFAEMTLTVWFDIGILSFVSTLVSRSELMPAVSIMETANSTARFAGSSVGGLLVRIFTAPVAIVADSISYFLSAGAVWSIRQPGASAPRAERVRLRDVGSAVAAGLRFVRRHKILGPLALAVGVNNIFWAAELALYVLYLARDLRLGAALIGLTMAAAGPGAIAGAALASLAQRRIGASGAIIGGLSVFAASALLIPLTPRQASLAVPVLMLAGFLMSAGGQVCSVNIIATRQIISPAELLGRINASFRFMAFGTSPLGSLLGGVLGTVLGVRTGLLIAVVGMFLAPLIVLLSPVRRLRRTVAAPADSLTRSPGGA